MSYLPPPPVGGSSPTGSPLAPRPVSLGEAISSFYANYANFNGRASRSEYWFVSLYTIMVQIPLSIWANTTGTIDPYTGIEQPNLFVSGIILLFAIVNFLPGLALAVRRLHDTNKSGAMLFIALIPCVGAFVLLAFFVSASDASDNLYGPAS